MAERVIVFLDFHTNTQKFQFYDSHRQMFKICLYHYIHISVIKHLHLNNKIWPFRIKLKGTLK